MPAYRPALRRYLATHGDINPTEYGGGYLVRIHPDGGLSPSYVALECVEWDNDEDNACGTLSRVCVPRDVLAEHPWIDVSAMSRSLDFDPDEWRRLAMSRKITDRARCIVDIASYYGWHELDHYPQRVKRGDRLWPRVRNVRSKPGV